MEKAAASLAPEITPASDMANHFRTLGAVSFHEVTLNSSRGDSFGIHSSDLFD
jgi:hypothetical protein